MAIKMVGREGQLRVGGRTAADFGEWSLATSDEHREDFSLTAHLRNGGPDRLLLDSGAPIVLRLIVGQQVWEWPAVQTVVGNPMVIYGSGHPEVR